MSTPDTPKELTWRGHTVYRCRLCAFDSTEREKFEDHFRKVHAPFQIIDGMAGVTSTAPDYHQMTRAELDIYGAEHGIADAADKSVYPTKADLIAAIDAALAQE